MLPDDDIKQFLSDASSIVIPGAARSASQSLNQQRIVLKLMATGKIFLDRNISGMNPAMFFR